MKKQIQTIIILAVIALTIVGCAKEKEGETKATIQTESLSLEQTKEEVTKETNFSEDTETESITEQTSQKESVQSTEETSQMDTAQTQMQETESKEDAMYFATGMYEKDARIFAQELVNHVLAGEKEAVAELIAYPRKITVPEEEAIVNNTEEFLVYYDKIFTESFCSFLENAVKEDFLWNNGMIAFGNGAVWFAPTANGTLIMTIQNEEGSSIRYDGESGVQTE